MHLADHIVAGGAESGGGQALSACDEPGLGLQDVSKVGDGLREDISEPWPLRLQERLERFLRGGQGAALEVAAPCHRQHHGIDQFAGSADHRGMRKEHRILENLTLEEVPRLAQGEPGQAGIASPVGRGLLHAGGADAQVHRIAAINERWIAHQGAGAATERRLGGHPLIGEGGEAASFVLTGGPLAHPRPRLLKEPSLQGRQFPALGEHGTTLIDDANVYQQMHWNPCPIPSRGFDANTKLALHLAG